jgi:hypothetical protein
MFHVKHLVLFNSNFRSGKMFHVEHFTRDNFEQCLSVDEKAEKHSPISFVGGQAIQTCILKSSEGEGKKVWIRVLPIEKHVKF